MRALVNATLPLLFDLMTRRFSEPADFVRYDGKSAPGFACARRLDAKPNARWQLQTVSVIGRDTDKPTKRREKWPEKFLSG